MARDESRSRVDFFVEREKRIEEEGGPEIHEARMAAAWLRRGFNADGSFPVVAADATVMVAAPVPPPVVVAAPAPPPVLPLPVISSQ